MMWAGDRKQGINMLALYAILLLCLQYIFHALPIL